MTEMTEQQMPRHTTPLLLKYTLLPPMKLPSFLVTGHPKMTQLSNKMKSVSFFLLILIPLLALMSPGHADCSLDSVVEKKIQKALSKLETGSQRTLYCTSVTIGGPLATCPSGFVVTGCACGYGCGSWDVRGDNTCHCQCSGMDWTSARCCKNY
ncbi:resistin-like beta [Petaurus breviceps papuanus]|uniref:resistin-like beta n=1 Tax=Petaurus breviceps papuanus TaxID=3040969 RepID=UPI0036D94BDF